MEKTITVALCQDCGKRGLPYVGMFSGCRFNGGSHRNTVRVEVDAEQAFRDLQAVLPGLPGFDQVRVRAWLRGLGR